MYFQEISKAEGGVSLTGKENYILIVDDNAGVRQLLFDIFCDTGYKVAMAASGVEAIAKVHTGIPALILLDAKMPGLNGIDALLEIKKFAPVVPVIMITAYTEQEIVINAKRSGLIKYHLSKPFDLDELRRLVDSILDNGDSNTATK